MNIPTASAHAAAVTQSGTWVSYAGTARIVLALGLLAAAAGVAYAGARLRRPLRPAQPGRTARFLILVTWVCSIVAFLSGLTIYAMRARQEHLLHAVPANNVAPVTAICVVAIFLAVPSHRPLAQPVGHAGQRRHRGDGRADDLRASV